MQSYLAIGDSEAFGETDFTKNPSNGNRGYVKLFADNYLAAQNGGVAPKVINTALDGETSSTFLHGGPANGDGSPGQPGYSLNTHYANGPDNQNAMMLTQIVDELKKGDTIGTVSVQLGANDLFTVLGSPGFSSMTPAQQGAALLQAIGGIQANYSTILTEIHSLLPNANLLLLGYQDPYAASPNSPMEQLAGPAIQALNKLIAAEASAFGGKYVDVYGAIKGHELQDTLIATGNVHPNSAGYLAIAAQMEAVATPEPSTLLILGASLAGWFVLGRRRRAD
jgi:lysophospholipase L1-like esterase